MVDVRDPFRVANRVDVALQHVDHRGAALRRDVVRDIHDQERSAAMIGWVMMGQSVVPLVGPTVGGVLDASFGWQSCFWVLFVLGSAMLVLVWADLGETARSRGRPMRAQLREYPELLRSPRFWGYTLCASFASGVYFAFLGGAPWVGENVFALSPAQLGLGLGAPALG